MEVTHLYHVSQKKRPHVSTDSNNMGAFFLGHPVLCFICAFPFRFVYPRYLLISCSIIMIQINTKISPLYLYLIKTIRLARQIIFMR